MSEPEIRSDHRCAKDAEIARLREERDRQKKLTDVARKERDVKHGLLKAALEAPMRDAVEIARLQRESDSNAAGFVRVAAENIRLRRIEEAARTMVRRHDGCPCAACVEVRAALTDGQEP